MTIDSMALFNLLDTAQANRIYKYISYDRLLRLENVEQNDYSIMKWLNIKNYGIKPQTKFTYIIPIINKVLFRTR